MLLLNEVGRRKKISEEEASRYRNETNGNERMKGKICASYEHIFA